MNWYYASGETAIGPLTEDAFAQAVTVGTVTADTLVWRDGEAAWRPYREFLAPAAPAPAPAPAPEHDTFTPEALGTAPEPAAAASGPEPAGEPATESYTPPASDLLPCAECGQEFSADDLLPIGELHICARCKPIYLQRLREGSAYRTGLNYATVGRRFGAIFLDGILMQAVSYGVQIPGMMAMSGQRPNGLIIAVIYLLPMVIAMLYETLMVGRYGATLGKMALGVRVVRPDGSPISYRRALGRHFAKILSWAIMMIGYIMAIFDKEEHRALHDRICDTRVIHLN